MSDTSTSNDDQKVGPVPTHTPSTASASASHAHEPHHIAKFGHVKTSGFVPDLNAFDEGDMDMCGAKGIRQKDLIREELDAEARRIHANRRYLFRKPRALQYFRGKTLVRADEERSSHRLELFFDLIFVGIIAVLAEEVIATPTGASLVRYIITYSMAWVIWSTVREVTNSYWSGDLYQSLLILYVMAALVVFGNNAIAIEDRLPLPSRATAVSSYLLAQLGLYGTQIFYSFHIKAFRAQIRFHIATWPFTSAIWIGAIFVPNRPAIAMAAVALILEYTIWIFAYSPQFKRILRLRYSSAVAIEHEVDRAADFYTLVLGECVYSIVSGHPAGSGFTAPTGRAILALMIAFCFLGFYTNGSSAKHCTHPLRHNMFSAWTWLSIHIPLVSALTLFGDACGDFVREKVTTQSIRWILCGTYAIGMVCVWIIAMIEKCHDKPGDTWIQKRWRMLPRLACALIAALLPLSRYHVLEAGAGETPETTGTGEGAAAHAFFSLLKRAATEAGSHGGGEEAFSVALTSTGILGILAALSMATMLWEQVGALDGPATEPEQAAEHLRAGDAHTPAYALRTPDWKGYPCVAEPGFMHFDTSHQRLHRNQENTIES